MSKHTGIRYHFCRDKMKTEEMKVVYCPTKDTGTDCLNQATSHHSAWSLGQCHDGAQSHKHT
eukprot:scaffold284721_cov19-Prasinocladus_malaysianus.AAC.1